MFRVSTSDTVFALPKTPAKRRAGKKPSRMVTKADENSPLIESPIHLTTSKASAKKATEKKSSALRPRDTNVAQSPADGPLPPRSTRRSTRGSAIPASVQKEQQGTCSVRRSVRRSVAINSDEPPTKTRRCARPRATVSTADDEQEKEKSPIEDSSIAMCAGGTESSSNCGTPASKLCRGECPAPSELEEATPLAVERPSTRRSALVLPDGQPFSRSVPAKKHAVVLASATVIKPVVAVRKRGSVEADGKEAHSQRPVKKTKTEYTVNLPLTASAAGAGAAINSTTAGMQQSPSSVEQDKNQASAPKTPDTVVRATQELPAPLTPIEGPCTTKSAESKVASVVRLFEDSAKRRTAEPDHTGLRARVYGKRQGTPLKFSTTASYTKQPAPTIPSFVAVISEENEQPVAEKETMIMAAGTSAGDSSTLPRAAMPLFVTTTIVELRSPRVPDEQTEEREAKRRRQSKDHYLSMKKEVLMVSRQRKVRLPKRNRLAVGDAAAMPSDQPTPMATHTAPGPTADASIIPDKDSAVEKTAIDVRNVGTSKVAVLGASSRGPLPKPRAPIRVKAPEHAKEMPRPNLKTANTELAEMQAQRLRQQEEVSRKQKKREEQEERQIQLRRELEEKDRLRVEQIAAERKRKEEELRQKNLRRQQEAAQRRQIEQELVIKRQELLQQEQRKKEETARQEAELALKQRQLEEQLAMQKIILQKKRMQVPSAGTGTVGSPQSYDISSLASDDEEEDDDSPSKPVPSWARGTALKTAIFNQFLVEQDGSNIFAEVGTPNMDEIFHKKK